MNKIFYIYDINPIRSETSFTDELAGSISLDRPPLPSHNGFATVRIPSSPELTSLNFMIASSAETDSVVRKKTTDAST